MIPVAKRLRGVVQKVPVVQKITVAKRKREVEELIPIAKRLRGIVQKVVQKVSVAKRRGVVEDETPAEVVPVLLVNDLQQERKCRRAIRLLDMASKAGKRMGQQTAADKVKVSLTMLRR